MASPTCAKQSSFAEISRQTGRFPSLRLQGMANHHVLGRIGTTDEIAEGIEYLSRAEWTTGEVLAIDGGLGLGVIS